jgi:hypothetical protein
MRSQDTFRFPDVNEGPVEPSLIPGFGGTSEIIRVVEGDLWVEVLQTPAGIALWSWSDDFEDDEEAKRWLTRAG